MRTRKPLRIELNRMENNETPMIEWYWNKMGGILCAEFPIAKRRKLDAVILPDKKRAEEVDKNQLSELLDERDVIVVQAKAKRLSMYLMGQAFFSVELIKRFHKPRSVRSIALCTESDPTLGPLLVSIGKRVGIRVGIEEFADTKLSQMSETPGSSGRQMIEQYWAQKGGTLYTFPNWDRKGGTRNKSAGEHFPHAVILRGRTKSKKEVLRLEDIPKGRKITVLHANTRPRLGMYLMGQALFGAKLVEQKLSTSSIRSVALSEKDDCILRPILEDIGEKAGVEMEVV